ncbi:hypothetical protein BH11MYX2_BH11MYX2_39800 [soil metagenome]
MKRWVLAIALIAGCKSKASTPDHTDPATGSSTTGSAASGSSGQEGSGRFPSVSGPAPKLEWKDADGELLVASDGGTLKGPCGLVGTISATDVSMGKVAAQKWNLIRQNGRTFTMDKLDWVIDIAASGGITFTRGGKKTPLGSVTGIDDASLPWFAALIVAGPMVQHELTLQVGAEKLVLQGAADLKSWDIRDDKGTRLASRGREDPAPLLIGDKPAWDPMKVKVTQNGDGWDIAVDRSDDSTTGSFDSAAFGATIKDGAIHIVDRNAPKDSDKPTHWNLPTSDMKLTGYTKCAAHDRAVTALLWAAFTTKGAHAVNFSAPASGTPATK